jgi:hemolysin III
LLAFSSISESSLITMAATREAELGAYYQHQDHNEAAAAATGSSAADAAGVWRVADFGNVSELSRDQSIHATDEVFNAASHLSATMLSILGTVLLISEASAKAEPWKIVSFSLYGASLIFLFGASTLHHALSGPGDAFLRMMDYLAIYPLIAGTFTPLCLVFYHDNVIGWVFCGTVWGLALVGMAATATCFSSIPKWLSMTMYISIGWLGACMTYWLLEVLGYEGFALFLGGGVLYTVGGYIFTVERPNPFPGRFGFHELWHVFVMLAALCHWLLMYFYILPWESYKV